MQLLITKLSQLSQSELETGMVLMDCTCMVMFALLVIVLCFGYVVIILASVRVVILGDLHVLWCTADELARLVMLQVHGAPSCPASSAPFWRSMPITDVSQLAQRHEQQEHFKHR